MTVARLLYRDAEAWLISAWPEGERVLRSPDDFSAEPQRRADPYLLGADGPDHAAIRSVYERVLRDVPVGTAELVQSALADFEESLDRCGDAELHEHLTTPLVARLVAAYLDVDRATAHALCVAARVAARVGAGDLVFDRATATMLGELTSVIGSIVGRDTSRCPNVPALLRAHGLPVEVVESLTRITVIGAVETTSRLIAETAMQAMLLGQQHAPLSMHLAVRAALGAHPPLRHVLRRSRRHITVTGETIPAGALVLVRLADGPPGAAFGVGVHRCPGRAHALALAHDVARSWTGWSARLAHVRADYGAPDLAIFGGPQTVHVTRLAGVSAHGERRKRRIVIT